MMAAVCATSLAFFPSVELHGDVLRLGDVADITALPAMLAERARGMPLLRVDRGTVQTAIARRDLAAQVTSRLPILAGCFDRSGPDPIVIRRMIADEIPRARAQNTGGIAKGEQVAIKIVSGPVAIERSGRAIDNAEPDERLFVRTGDGQVVRTIVEGNAP